MRDDGNRQPVFIEASEVTAERQGIAVVLRTSPPPQPGETDAAVPRPERLVLSLPAATRLSMALQDVLRDRRPEPGQSDIDVETRSGHRSGDGTASGGREELPPGDETGMTTTYVNTTGVTAGRDGIEIFFGVEKARQSGKEEVGVKLVRSVSMEPAGARKLAIDLDDALDNHRVEFGSQGPPDRVPVPGQGSRTRPPQEGAPESEDELDKLLLLFRQVGSLDAVIDFEPSFKLVDSRFLENRFLLGTSRDKSDADWGERIALICENIGMPHDLLASFEQGLPDANHVYFGVEKNERSLLLKAYLEFRDKAEKDIGEAPAGDSVLLFTGFKWDSRSPTRQAVSRYMWYPSLAMPGILERLGMTFGKSSRGGLLEVIENIANRTAERTSPRDIQYLEVTEEGNPRKSFDVNIYKSGLLLQDLHEDLLRALRLCAIPRSRFEPFYQRIKTERVGHLAGGVDRDNRDFLTVYFGVRNIHSSQLATATIARRG